MIVDLPGTTTSKVARELVALREEGGAVALGRVLTLVIVAPNGGAEEAIAAANEASREHPMRVVVLILDAPDDSARVDAQIRVGGDAGASEVVILHAYGAAASTPESLVTGLLLPDAPVIAWWPQRAPQHPADSAIGRIATRRITDAATPPFTPETIIELGQHYAPGDTDLAWTRLTRWREQLAAVLDQPPYEQVTHVSVAGADSSPSTVLLAAWLGLELDVPVTWTSLPAEEWSEGIKSVRLTRASGDIVLERSTAALARLTQPGQPDHDLVLPRRSLRECLAEELRHLDPDALYGRVVTQGWERLGPATQAGDHDRDR